MRLGAITLGCVLMAALATASAWASAGVYVDCGAAPGGDGSKKAPFHSITAALPTARQVAREAGVTIDVAEGVCNQETLPIELDFPVHLRGSRSPSFDIAGLPVDAQDSDTLLTWNPPSPVPPSAGQLVFLRITGPDVRITKLSVDGRITQPRTAGPQVPAPTAVLAHAAMDFALERLRLVGVGIAIRVQGAGGHVRDTFVGRVGAGLVASGGTVSAPPTVRAENNRIDDYSTGGLAILGAGPAGNTIRAEITGNDIVTTYADTGPSNPFGLRMGPIFSGGPFLDGAVHATFVGNAFRGTPRYAIIINSPQTVRRADGRHYSGTLDADFAGNLVERLSITRAPSLITFTNSRATELPCELNPASTRATCPSLSGNPLQHWEYLERSSFRLLHTGELDGALLDHPVTEPADGRVLGNELVINGSAVDHQTFVVVP